MFTRACNDNLQGVSVTYIMEAKCLLLRALWKLLFQVLVNSIQNVEYTKGYGNYVLVASNATSFYAFVFPRHELHVCQYYTIKWSGNLFFVFCYRILNIRISRTNYSVDAKRKLFQNVILHLYGNPLEAYSRFKQLSLNGISNMVCVSRVVSVLSER